MPVKSDVNWDDCCKAAFPTLLPIGISGIGYYMFSQRKDQLDWFDKLRKPWGTIAMTTTHAVLDLATIAPIGYAAHLICKEVRNSDRQYAIGLYGASLLAYAASIPVYTNSKDLKIWFGTKALTAGLFGATAFAFYKLHDTAGMLTIPFAVWLTHGAISMFALMQANPGPF